LSAEISSKNGSLIPGLHRSGKLALASFGCSPVCLLSQAGTVVRLCGLAGLATPSENAGRIGLPLCKFPIALPEPDLLVPISPSRRIAVVNGAISTAVEVVRRDVDYGENELIVAFATVIVLDVKRHGVNAVAQGRESEVASGGIGNGLPVAARNVP